LDRLTRKELKTDKFAQEVTHSLEYVSGHRKQTLTYGGVALALVVIVAGFWYWRRSSHQDRQHELAMALRLTEAVVMQAPPPDDPRPVFATKGEKDRAVRKAFNDIISRHAGSDEADVSHYSLGVMAADEGNLTEAEKHLKIVAEDGGEEHSSSAKFALAQVYVGQNKRADAERLLRELMNDPTHLVSKEQATVALARLLASSKPEEARKLLEPLQKDERAAISRNAAQVLSELPPAPSSAPAPPAARPK
jgi:predicted negative regulator of RcsB-dependent stress response